jgi:hypothetical protein
MKNSRVSLKHPRFAKSWRSFTPSFADPRELVRFDLPWRSGYIGAPDHSQRTAIKLAGFLTLGLTSRAAEESDRVKYSNDQISNRAIND